MAEEARRLGRGLAALIGSTDEESAVGSSSRNPQRKAPVEFLRANPRNPRREFGEADLEDLTASVREKGILQPIVVRAIASDLYEIIAGERRWRAAQKAGLHEVPIIVVSANDQEALELAIIENVQRTDLNPMEEALGYERLVSDYGYSHGDLAKTIGKSRSHVANMIRLVRLPEKTRQLLTDGKITAGHARALLSVGQPDEVARDIVEKGLTVRDVERLAQDNSARQQSETDAQKKAPPKSDPNVVALERRIGEILGLTVSIKSKGEAGEMILKYRSLDQLDEIMRKLGVSAS